MGDGHTEERAVEAWWCFLVLGGTCLSGEPAGEVGSSVCRGTKESVNTPIVILYHPFEKPGVIQK